MKRVTLGELLLALRLARREMRGGVRGFGVFLTCLALGVAAITAVGVFSASVDDGLAREARRLLGGDVHVERTHVPPGDDVTAVLAAEGEVSRTARMRTMARPATEGAPALVALKAVDAAYPLFGRMELESGRSLPEALAVVDGLPGAVCERELLLRLDARLGDQISVGAARYRLTDIIVREPDRLAQFFGLGPRLMVSLETLQATGIVQPGALVRYAETVRLRPGAGPDRVAAIESALRERFGEERGLRIRTHRSRSGGMAWFMDNLEIYLTLVGLASLLVGGIGVAGAVRAFLAGRGTGIAVMKALGAPRRLVLSVYLFQSMFMALAGSLAGAAIGYCVVVLGAEPLAQRLGAPLGHGVYAQPVLLAVAYGLLSALAFALWPLSTAGNVSPARLFRGYADPEVGRPGRWALTACAVCVFAMFALLAATSSNPRVALGFGVASLAAMAVFQGYATCIKRLAAAMPRWKAPALRQAVAGLHRPGASTVAVLFSLGLGLTVLSVVFLVDGNIQDRIGRRTPATAPAYFFLGIPKARGAEMEALALAQEGVTRVERTPTIRGRILEIDGVPAYERDVARNTRWALRSDRALTFAGPMAEDVELVQGDWWPEGYSGPPLICLDNDLADGFVVGPGDTLTVNVLGRRITGEIACTREIDYATGGINHALTFSPGVLEAAPYTWLATAYTDRGAEEGLFNAVTAEFPGVVAISMREVLEELAGIARDVGWAVRACAGVALLAGLLVLAEALRANLRTRHRDAVVFKVLGATRGNVLAALVLEFGLLGVAAALPAAILGVSGSWLFVRFALHGSWVFLVEPLVVVLVGGIVAAVGFGVLGVRKALRGSAWSVLRNE